MDFIQRVKLEFRELLSMLTVEELVTNKRLINQAERIQSMFIKMA
jgi:hypothetical protein